MLSAIFCVDKKGLHHFAVSATSLAIHRPQPNLTQAFLLSVDVTQSDVSHFFEVLLRENTVWRSP